jgi:hypothetical protein
MFADGSVWRPPPLAQFALGMPEDLAHIVDKRMEKERNLSARWNRKCFTQVVPNKTVVATPMPHARARTVRAHGHTRVRPVARHDREVVHHRLGRRLCRRAAVRERQRAQHPDSCRSLIRE